MSFVVETIDTLCNIVISGINLEIDVDSHLPYPLT